jgi:hypothetical protein
MTDEQKIPIMLEEVNRWITEPAPAKSLLRVLALLRPLHEEFPGIEDPIPSPVEV